MLEIALDSHMSDNKASPIVDVNEQFRLLVFVVYLCIGLRILIR